MKPMKLLAIAFAFAATGLFTSAANAEYPERPINLVVPYGPGGAADLAARIMANEAPEYLGGNILVSNQAGAAGVTGSTIVANSPADGYTLLMSRVGGHAVVPAMNETIPYKWDDFTFLGLIEKNPFVLAVNADSPYQNFAELKAAIEAGERLTFASAGVGSLLQMSVIILLDDMGLASDALIHVPFKGGGGATTAVVSGNADIIFHNLSGLSGAIQSGQLRPLMTTTTDRFPSIPDTPTASELGHPNLEVIVGWTGVWGPKDLPEEVTAKWADVLQQIKVDDSWLESTKKLGSLPTVLTSEETKAFVEGQVKTFRAVAEKLDMIVR